MEFSIVQWNVGTEDEANIIQEVHRWNPMVLTSQECSENAGWCRGLNVAETAAAVLGYECFFAQGHHFVRKAGQHERHGNAILSRFSMLEGTDQRQIKEAGEFADLNSWDTAPRVYVRTALQLPETTSLTIATYHSAYTDWFTNDEVKRPEIDRLIVQLQLHRQRFILAGDFNSLPQSKTVQSILAETDLRYCGPEMNGGTWPNKNLHVAGRDVEADSYWMDYIFCTPDLAEKCTSAELLRTQFSDHHALRCTFEL